MTYRSTPDLLAAVKSSAQLQSDLKADPIGALEKMTMTGVLPDTWIYRLVIVALALTIFATAGGAIYLGDKTPQSLVALGSTALGGLVGLLAPSPRQAS